MGVAPNTTVPKSQKGGDGMAMSARVFRTSGDEASNGGGYEYSLCVLGKVHLTYSTSWYDQAGCEELAFDAKEFHNFSPCNGSCMEKTVELPSDVEAQVKNLIEGRLAFSSAQSFEWEKKRYPDETDPSML